jgi:CubicO group peptidase (beta-lactamase class C family)
LACAALASPATATGPTETAAAHRVFFDDVFSGLMAEHEIPGLAAVLVQNGETVFSAGYGLADVRRQIPVDAQRTIFPLGSVSKLLTTVAVLQLVENGTLDLNADIGPYLAPLRYDQRFTTPVTLRHLLTHTDGFDVRWLVGGAARVPKKVQPLSALMADLPPRIMPPGETYLYSDVGMTIAGYVVERVSHRPFADYMEQHVFEPLGMQQSSFRPTRENYARNRATGYAYNQEGRLAPVPVMYPHALPASGATAPISDLAPFMISLLPSRDSGTNPLLNAATVREMWRQQFAHHAAMPGTAFGFYEFFHHGHRALVHGGLLPGFTTVMVLLPEAGVGLCVAGNRFDLIGAFEDQLLRQLIEHFLPIPAEVSPSTFVARPQPRDVTLLEGTYRCDQYSRLSIDKLFVLAGMATELRVTANADGSLRIGPREGRWIEIADRLYANETTGERLAFRDDPLTGDIRIVGSAQFMSYHRIGVLDRLGAHYALFAGLPLLCLSATCVGGWSAWRARRHGVSLRSGWLVARRVSMTVTLIALLVFLGWFAASLAQLDFFTAAVGEPRSLAAIPYAGFALALVGIVQIALVFFSRRGSPAFRAETIASLVAAAAVLLLIPVLHSWNLLWLPFASS